METRTMFARLSLVVLLLALSGPDVPAQTGVTRNVMREKLVHSQKILEAIMTSDFKGLEEHSTAIVNLTKTEGWAVLKSAEYQRQSAAFVRALDDLVATAKQKNLDVATIQYMAMTMTCYECHRHLKNTRIAATTP
jgi:hypothetical protein